MPIQKSTPNVRSDGTSTPRETALVIIWLVQQIVVLQAKLIALEARVDGIAP